mmetsp:Transcript_3208/g.4815  ORF Transcript_3208/g.4815 Transcript_3208/m.4815 type:complete len:89 (+) Transcript_3208:210-476(+)
MELPQMMNSIYHYHPTNQRRIHSSLPLFFYPRSSSPFSSPPSDMMNVFVAVTIKEYSAANLMRIQVSLAGCFADRLPIASIYYVTIEE